MKRGSVVTNGFAAEHSRPNSGKGPFFEPAEEIPERPMTPNPYSVLRKVSEVSEPDSDNDLSPKDDQQLSPELQHQETTHRLSTINTPQGPATHGRRSLNHMSAKPTANDSDMAHSTPILRDEAGRVISRVHPLSRASVLDSELQHSPYTVASSSVQADYGGSEAGAAANAPEGIVVLNSPDATEIAPKAGLPMRNFSLHSRRATTIQSEIPDLASLRLGPRIRHNRLPKSPSTAVNAGLGVPKSTKKLWTSLGRSRKMMIISAILLQLVILNLVASVTAVVVSHIEQGSAGTGLVAWAAVSGVFVLTLAGLLAITFLQYRKMSENLVSDENWIEMHLRSRPLPPRPKSEERKKEDDGATEAWQKFAQDHTQLRRYVEFLETRVGVLEEGRTDMSGANNTTPSNIANGIGQTGGGNVDSDAGDNTPKAKKLNASSSMSHRQLLQPEPSLAGSESWQGSDNSGRIPRSDTKASILTELCEAVTEGYSPLSEQMPRGSPQVPQTPNMHTPSARPRDSVAHHLAVPGRAVIHQRGVRSVDLMGTRMDDI
jgi:hypothetical protein